MELLSKKMTENYFYFGGEWKYSISYIFCKKISHLNILDKF